MKEKHPEFTERLEKEGMKQVRFIDPHSTYDSGGVELRGWKAMFEGLS